MSFPSGEIGRGLAFAIKSDPVLLETDSDGGNGVYSRTGQVMEMAFSLIV